LEGMKIQERNERNTLNRKPLKGWVKYFQIVFGAHEAENSMTVSASFSKVIVCSFLIHIFSCFFPSLDELISDLPPTSTLLYKPKTIENLLITIKITFPTEKRLRLSYCDA
jgi:hypothetical protein